MIFLVARHRLNERTERMNKYILLVETGADMPAELADRFGIYQVPMHVSFGTETRDDGKIPIHELFPTMKKPVCCPKQAAARQMTLKKYLMKSIPDILTVTSFILPILRQQPVPIRVPSLPQRSATMLPVLTPSMSPPVRR